MHQRVRIRSLLDTYLLCQVRWLRYYAFSFCTDYKKHCFFKKTRLWLSTRVSEAVTFRLIIFFWQMDAREIICSIFGRRLCFFLRCY